MRGQSSIGQYNPTIGGTSVNLHKPNTASIPKASAHMGKRRQIYSSSLSSLAMLSKSVVRSKTAMFPTVVRPVVQYCRLRKHAIGLEPIQFPKQKDRSQKALQQAGYDKGVTERLVSTIGSQSFASYTADTKKRLHRQKCKCYPLSVDPCLVTTASKSTDQAKTTAL